MKLKDLFRKKERIESEIRRQRIQEDMEHMPEEAISIAMGAIKLAGSPKGFGEGKNPTIEGLSEPGTIQRVNQLKELEDLAKLWKLQAVDSYKHKMGG